MADTGFRFPDTLTSDASAGGTAAWGTPSNAAVDDGTATTASPSLSIPSHYLKATDFDFDAADPTELPATATLDGIEVVVKAKVASGSTTTLGCRMFDPGSLAYAGDTKTSSALTTSYVEYTFGGPSDLWNLAGGITIAEFRNSGFGFGTRATNTGASPIACDIDVVKIKLYFTPAELVMPLIATAELPVAMFLPPPPVAYGESRGKILALAV